MIIVTNILIPLRLRRYMPRKVFYMENLIQHSHDPRRQILFIHSHYR